MLFRRWEKGDTGWSERLYTFGQIFRKRADCGRLQANRKFNTVLIFGKIWRALFVAFFMNYALFALFKSLSL
jgi:hypothetical protein